MGNKYNVFMELLNFKKDKYSAEKIFRDFISLFAISLSNKIAFNKQNNEMYEKIYNSYEKEEQYIFYALSSELTKLFCNEIAPYDILGDIYQKITNKSYLQLISNNPAQQIGKKLQGIININKRTNSGKMIEMNCGSGAMILAYASILKMFKLDYKINLEVTAIDTNIINVFMTYIQLYFYEITAVVILIDAKNNKEIMKLYTEEAEDDIENRMIA